MRNNLSLKYIMMVISLTCLNSLISAQTISKLELDREINTDGILISDQGIIFCTEGWNGSRVFRIENGTIEVFAQDLNGPIDILQDSEGNFYVSEWNGGKGDGRISRLSPSGQRSTLANVKPGPGPMAFNSEGDLYVTHNINNGSGYISVISPDGKIQVKTDPLFINPGGIVFDESGAMFVSNFNNGNIIRVVDGNTKVLATIPGHSFWKTGHLELIRNQIYVTALQENKIYQVDPVSGEIQVVIENVLNPNGLSYDSSAGFLYFTRAFKSASYISKLQIE